MDTNDGPDFRPVFFASPTRNAELPMSRSVDTAAAFVDFTAHPSWVDANVITNTVMHAPC
ncbi:MAG TPA: hypothetical protein PKO41_10880 [Dokdonella sp.]|nr:hypothetical protein [Dokdonella sp.]